MVRRVTPAGRFVQRFLLTAMLGLALASRLALGASVSTGVPADTAASSAVARLQAVMVMCDPGQTSKPPPSQHPQASFDDLLVLELADNAHALPGAPVPLPLAASVWLTVEVSSTSLSDPPIPYRAAQQPRGPPSIL
ncbi:hypothetical protein ACELLULO517_26555 [Acidisoma cellulosilytica]|uniref:Secreted protein n=1 Tax=Acidisoma cellulosilyticum TaxID=2802395 RepID=A0A963Z764_9PROT|nr:hypothetical protein [Acidisoma cellulosilyticum]MCB8883836.1 hypothetical protein [Acidisoma cellulosilyticum]